MTHHGSTLRDYGQDLVGRWIRFVPPSPEFGGEHLDLQVSEVVDGTAQGGDESVVLIGNPPNNPSRRLKIELTEDVSIEFIDDNEQPPAP